MDRAVYAIAATATHQAGHISLPLYMPVRLLDLLDLANILAAIFCSMESFDRPVVQSGSGPVESCVVTKLTDTGYKVYLLSITSKQDVQTFDQALLSTSEAWALKQTLCVGSTTALPADIPVR